MIPKSFKVAMRNALRIGPYEPVYETAAESVEWLIVERSGPNGELLTISDTSTPVDDPGDEAPSDLAARHTLAALLADQSNSDSLEFLIVRHLPDNASPAGTFFPGDGYVRLFGDSDGLALHAFGRHAHSRGSDASGTILHDIPNPAPSASGAINWHFDAEERPWAG